MSAVSTTLPPKDVYESMTRAIAAKNHAEVRTLLRQHPSLASTDYNAFRQAYRTIPLIFDAIEKGDAELYDILLEAGSSPIAPRGGSYNALLTLIWKSDCSEVRLRMLERALAHPECAKLGKPDVGFPDLIEIEQACNFMHGHSGKQEDRRRAIFQTLLKRTPQDALEKYVKLEAFLTSDASQGSFIFMSRALADRGLNLNATKEPRSSFMRRLQDKGLYEALSAVLAAGYVETAKDIADALPKYQSGVLHANAIDLLQKEADRVRKSEITPQQLLLTEEGRPTWQARGMVTMGLLQELFAGADAAHFGNGESQAELLAKIYEALHPEQRTAAVLRSAPLARPAESATVEYVRGGAEVARKGGVA